MIMQGNVSDIRTRRGARSLRGLGDSDSTSKSSSGGGAAQTSVPVSTQVTTQVSPVFNIAAGNTGGGATNQSGSTAMTTTPTVANNQPFSGSPNGALPNQGGVMGDGLGMPSGNDPYSQGSYDSTSSQPTVNGEVYDPYAGMPPVASAGIGGINMRTMLLLAGVGVAAWLLMSKSGKAQMVKIRRKTGTTKRRAKRRAK